MNALNASTNPKQQGLVPSVLLAGVLALIGAFLHLWITQSTSEFREIGIGWSMMGVAGLACFLLPLTILVAWVVSVSQRRRRLPRWITRKAFVASGMTIMIAAVLLGLVGARAEARLAKVTGGTGARFADVQVMGFNSFLASRWLYSFEATEEDVVSIASSLRLETFEGIDLKASLERDVFFSSRPLPIADHVPGEEASLAYASSEEHGQSVEWTTLVYSDSAKRAWLFKGFQN